MRITKIRCKHCGQKEVQFLPIDDCYDFDFDTSNRFGSGDEEGACNYQEFKPPPCLEHEGRLSKISFSIFRHKKCKNVIKAHNSIFSHFKLAAGPLRRGGKTNLNYISEYRDKYRRRKAIKSQAKNKPPRHVGYKVIKIDDRPKWNAAISAPSKPVYIETIGAMEAKLRVLDLDMRWPDGTLYPATNNEPMSLSQRSIQDLTMSKRSVVPSKTKKTHGV